MRTSIALLIALSLTLTLAAETRAQKQDLRVRITGSGVARSDFDQTDGRVQETRAALEARYSLLKIGYEGRFFDWNETESIAFSRGETPWQTLHRLTAGITYGGRLTRDWNWFAGATGHSSFEEQLDDSYGGAFRLGGTYQASDNVSIDVGAGLFANAVEIKGLPLLSVNYDGLDQSGTGWTARLGTGGTFLSYRPMRNLGIVGQLDLENDTYRMADDSDVRPEGYVKIRHFVGSLFLEIEPTDNLSFTGGPQYHFGREYTFYNQDGDEQNTFDVDPAFGGLIEAKYKF
ncbi:hypothetical protein [Desulfohalovibrio reitneri]|uniref:hypothetical protein n=1 Tax=Desulfohalovibrio reitneri TaxID=1307759 RepID=UPI0004A6F876|nr:hypothetical protein [Desulfohalovibrio reitneri]